MSSNPSAGPDGRFNKPTDDPAFDPIEDPQRDFELSELSLTDPWLRRQLDEASRQAAQHVALPLALVSIVLPGMAYQAGRYAADGQFAEERCLPLDWTFCATTVRTGRPYVVADASRDPAHASSPPVTELGAGCYAGAPLVSSRGQVLGALCVVGPAPRLFTDVEVADLEVMAAYVVPVLEAARTGAAVQHGHHSPDGLAPTG